MGRPSNRQRLADERAEAKRDAKRQIDMELGHEENTKTRAITVGELLDPQMYEPLPTQYYTTGP